MTTWAPEKGDTLQALGTEILHNYSVGRAPVALDGPDRAAVAAFADDLGASIVALGHAAARASLPAAAEPYDEKSFRAEVIDPLREPGEVGDVLLLVDGALTDHPELAGLWNYSIWVTGSDAADRSLAGRARATAVIDNTDPSTRGGSSTTLADERPRARRHLPQPVTR
ncbi:hypothetical protein AX769_14475 [Frondihabitans sp. PAMC 28766]|uniref:hypothetical protein n=1 Tax=Frondihabitans sp. PAMC 28766 TaxID=1795630 RepID=UPI00078DCA25|nr:hypothetical protein [Frondihabitans sp. PAMC 28766]AMM21123.1 hypothetical protein AX769_14475 [Frondihabitans sp. PAMC 28766]